MKQSTLTPWDFRSGLAVLALCVVPAPAYGLQNDAEAGGMLLWIFVAAGVLAGLAYLFGRRLGKKRSKPETTVQPPPPVPTSPPAVAVQSSPVSPVPSAASPPAATAPTGPVSPTQPAPSPSTETETQTTRNQAAKGLSDLFGLASPRALDYWWVRVPAKLRRYSAVLSTAWADGMYLTAWPRWAMLLSFFSLAFGFVEGTSHWSFLTVDATGAASPPAIVFAQMLPLLVVAVVVGALSANAGVMLVLGYAVGDYMFAGPQVRISGNVVLPQFFYLRVPQLVSYIFFFMLSTVPILLTKSLLSGLNRRIQGADIPSQVVRTGAAALVQAALVYGWTLAAVMVIRISWAWAGQSPPLSERYYLNATDPWLPVAAAASVLVRGWLTHRARRCKTLQARVRELLLALLAAEKRRALPRRFPTWARIALTALVMTLLTAGYINSLPLGAVVFIAYGAILLARARFLPKLGIWAGWTGTVSKIPLLARLALVILAGYLITKSVLALPGQATQLNGVPGQFGPELAIALLGLLVAVALLPQTSASTAQKGAATKSTQLRNVGAQLILLASIVLLTTSRAYADICLDPTCCFGADRFTLLAMAGLLLLLAILLLWPVLEMLWPILSIFLDAVVDIATAVPRMMNEIMGTLLGDVLFPAPAPPTAGEIFDAFATTRPVIEATGEAGEALPVVGEAAEVEAAGQVADAGEAVQEGEAAAEVEEPAADEAAAGNEAQQQAENAVDHDIINNENNFNHIFNNEEHNWDLTGLDQEGNLNLIRETIENNFGAMPDNGVYEVTQNFGDYAVTVRGAVVDGVVRIGSAWVNAI